MIIHYLFSSVDVGITYFLLNIPLILLGWLSIGKRFMLYTILGMAFFSLAATFLKTPPVPLEDPILVAVFGGVVCGAGAGIVLRSLGSAGGVDILAIYVNNKFGLRPGLTSFFVNGLIMKRNGRTNIFPVLIAGESGTGKELFAQAIHHASARKLYPFVRINCAAIPKNLLESELFGYEKGAFTGAGSSGKPGKFELAHKGTLFLDEVGDLPLEMQPKLLRAIEDYEFERVGGTKVIRTNLRVIAATNQDLEQMLVDGRFRKDLFYRLNVIPLHIPPLRERKTDIIHIAQWMLKQMAVEANIPEVKLDAVAQNAFKRHQWPGNVRELSNVLERTLSALERSTIRLQDLPFYLYRNSKESSEQNPSSLKDLQARTEKETIHDALKASNNNKAKAARMLGIHRTLLYKKMKKYDIPLDSSGS